MQDYWYSPKPKRLPIRFPGRKPVRTAPSMIEEDRIVLNMLMNYTRGRDVYDHSPYKNHGAIYGAEWIEGSYGWGLDFVEAETDYVQVPDDPSLDITGEISILGWVKFRSIDANVQTLVAKRGAVGNRANYGINTNSASGDEDALDFYFYDGGFRDNRYEAGFVAGDWYHFATTFDEAADEVKFYVNGSLGNTVSQTNSLLTNDYPVSIGQNGEDGEWLDGQEAMLFILTRILSGDEVSEHFERTRGIFGV